MSSIVAAHSVPSGQSIEICQGDLLQERVDAIVNAANSHLAHGGGVAGAILRAGGRVIALESKAWVKEHGPVTHAEPAYTSGGALPCRYVIHAVGPIWGSGEEDRKLAEAVHGSLALADQLGLRSIAFPFISTGIYGFPKQPAARVILDTIWAYYRILPGSPLHLTRLVLREEESVQIFIAEAQRQLGPRPQ
jgi:O-acetyl-ADP-ribose deacetylase